MFIIPLLLAVLVASLVDFIDIKMYDQKKLLLSMWYYAGGRSDELPPTDKELEAALATRDVIVELNGRAINMKLEGDTVAYIGYDLMHGRGAFDTVLLMERLRMAQERAEKEET
jgi:hypothetical protein